MKRKTTKPTHYRVFTAQHFNDNTKDGYDHFGITYTGTDIELAKKEIIDCLDDREELGSCSMYVEIRR